VTDGDPLGVEQFGTHHLPLDQALHAYEIFQKKQDGAIKILFRPGAAPAAVGADGDVAGARTPG
jgi:hypothetical protein